MFGAALGHDVYGVQLFSHKDTGCWCLDRNRCIFSLSIELPGIYSVYESS